MSQEVVNNKDKGSIDIDKHIETIENSVYYLFTEAYRSTPLGELSEQAYNDFLKSIKEIKKELTKIKGE